MFAFEVYGTRDDLYQTHLSSPAMQRFLTLIPPCSTTGLDLNHYRLIAGFLDSPSPSPTPATIMQDMRIICTSPGARTTLLGALKAFAESISPSDETLTYMAFASLDDDVGARIYGRWKSREGFEAFIRQEDVVAFWMAVKENVKGMDQRLYVPNGKGWVHRGNGYAGEEVGKAKI
ncbi:hypothetical protein BKA63DRAFT_507478 [Paraphoma chrysanthemicola]|nr:hypothetical protein BKA63DRAFT_507478 [Paraphoma chrysanthemicola]